MAPSLARRFGPPYPIPERYENLKRALTVRDSIFTGNTATDFGGGIANGGGLTIQDRAVLGNTALLGGDLYNAGAVSVFDSLIGDRYDF